MVIIHQALFGELKDGSFGLIRTSLPDDKLAKKISFQTDLLDRPPSGILWLPIIRGFKFDDFYLIVKTYPDKSPNVRHGRVFSHTLIIESKDLYLINDVYKLFQVFNENLDKNIDLIALDYNSITLNNISEKNAELGERFNKVIHGIIETTIYDNVIVWIGQENFEQVIFKSWKIIPENERSNFTFGINFNIREVSTKSLNIITTPESLENKWVSSKFCIVRKNEIFQLNSFIEKLFSGESQEQERFNKFLEEIDFFPTSIQDFKFLAKGILTFENLDSITDFKQVFALINIVAKFCNEIEKGKVLKERLINKLSILISNADPKEISALKNLKTNCFLYSEEKLALACSNWIEQNLFSLSYNINFDATIILKSFLNISIEQNWLKNLMKEKFQNFLSYNNQKLSIIWQWIIKDISIIPIINDYLENTSKLEDEFTINFPENSDGNFLKEIRKFALDRNWLKLYAKAPIKEFDFFISIEEFFKVETGDKNIDALNIILKEATPEILISYTIKKGDDRLIKHCGEICHNDPRHLENIDVSNINWQSIWNYSIYFGNDLQTGIKDTKQKVFYLLDLILNNQTINENLIKEISKSEYANILEYKNRKEIWDKIPIKFKGDFLRKTSSEYLEICSKDPSFEIFEDSVLEKFITSSNAISDFLYLNRNNFKVAFPIFSKFSLPESYLKDYINNYQGYMDSFDSIQLGKFVYNKSFNSVAQVILNKAKINNTFKIALNECYLILDLLNIGYLFCFGLLNGSPNISENEWWKNFLEITCKLYSSPRDKKIWLEAGGLESDLLENVTGKEAWTDALNGLKNKSFGKFTLNNLLDKMIFNHHKNEELKILKYLKENI